MDEEPKAGMNNTSITAFHLYRSIVSSKNTSRQKTARNNLGFPSREPFVIDEDDLYECPVVGWFIGRQNHRVIHTYFNYSYASVLG